MADIGEEYEIDPEQDLRPVCANCHRMLHRKRRAISIEELKELISQKNVNKVDALGKISGETLLEKKLLFS